MTQITMPKLSDTMLEGTLVKWHKKPGEKISIGDVIAEVETDKATMEMEAFDEGTLTDILIPEGGVVKVGDPIATLDGGSTESAKKPAAAPAAKAPVAPSAPSASAKIISSGAPSTPRPAPRPSANGVRVKASPLARKVALERGIDLSRLQGSGPGGRIVVADLDSAPTSSRGGQAAPAVVKIDVPCSDADKRTPLNGMRRTIAERLLASKTQIPHFYLTMEVDAAPLAKLRKEINAAAEAAGSPKITVNDFVLLATARAAAQHPKINAAFAGDSVVEYADVNLSVAIAVEDGLITPVVRKADKLSLREISAAVKDLAVRARSKKIKPEEYAGGTITVSNLGAYGVDSFYAIVNPPQAVILAVGAIVKKPVVGPADQIVAGQRMSIALSGDHRVVDGALGAEFLAEIRKSLEAPATLLF
ncbi:MAG: dihydrolipoamide acetyltransferase family protein [Terrimicrobiaceae bacterium]